MVDDFAHSIAPCVRVEAVLFVNQALSVESRALERHSCSKSGKKVIEVTPTPVITQVEGKTAKGKKAKAASL